MSAKTSKREPALDSKKKRFLAAAWHEIKGLALIAAIFIVLRGSVFGHYVIPSGSMQPTLKINDHVVANKLAYGLMLPFGETMVMQWSRPQRGDIVLFKSKATSDTLIKRVIGIGGDTISFRQGTLQINGVAVKEALQKDLSILSDLGEFHDDKDLLRESSPDFTPKHDNHFVLRLKSEGNTRREIRDFVVPAGEVFCLGDNRDGSVDSRFWGFVPELNLYGRASFIAFSTQHNAATWWPPFRTDRFFQSLN
jgi:signal peptidase I